MVEVQKLGIILKSTNLEFENFSVLNPGAYQDGNIIHLFYRAVDTDHKSSIGYAKLNGPTSVIERWTNPILRREFDYESHGLEDPRIIKLEDKFYLTYVAHDGKNAVTAYATSADLKTFQKQGIITPQIKYHDVTNILDKSELRLKDAYFYFSSYYEEQAGEDVLLWDKDVFFFPRKINGKYALIHRVLPDIQIAFFDDFEELKTEQYWRNYLTDLPKYVILENKHWFESRNIGGGCAPIETDAGWIFIFHSVEEKNEGRIYHAVAALLNKDNPLEVIGRLHEPLFSPTEQWEIEGPVKNVVFPTATAVFGDDLYIYYGATDQYIAVARVSIQKLLTEMLDPAKKHRSNSH